jgi:hypothetical protein
VTAVHLVFFDTELNAETRSKINQAGGFFMAQFEFKKNPPKKQWYAPQKKLIEGKKCADKTEPVQNSSVFYFLPPHKITIKHYAPQTKIFEESFFFVLETKSP